MSWSATGSVDGPFTATDLDWSQPYEDYDADAKQQADFMVDVVNRGFAEGAIAGRYSLSIQGATDHSGDPVTHGEGGGRKHLYMNLVPVSDPPAAEAEESQPA